MYFTIGLGYLKGILFIIYYLFFVQGKSFYLNQGYLKGCFLKRKKFKEDLI